MKIRFFVERCVCNLFFTALTKSITLFTIVFFTLRGVNMPRYELLGDFNPFVTLCIKWDEHFSYTPWGGTYPLDFIFPPGTICPVRYSRGYEIQLVHSEEATVFINGEKHNVRKGNILFHRPGFAIQVVAPYYASTIVFFLVYSNDSFVDPFSSEIESIAEYKNSFTRENLDFPLDFPLIMETKQYNEYESLFTLARKEFMKNRYETFFITKTYLMQIILQMYIECTSIDWQNHPSRSIRKNYAKVMQIKRYIDNNISQQNFKLQDLAKISDLSPNFLCKIFKTIMGDTLTNYINKARIDLVKQMLIETNMDIKEICFECGFDSIPYFFTLFKKIAGLSPSAFREKYMF